MKDTKQYTVRVYMGGRFLYLNGGELEPLVLSEDSFMLYDSDNADRAVEYIKSVTPFDEPEKIEYINI